MNGVQIRIRGKVQGVGFRPFVWQLARAQARCGDVCNDGDGVLVRLVGGDDGFTAALADHCPPLARIDSTACIPYRWAATPQDFTIREWGGTDAGSDCARCRDLPGVPRGDERSPGTPLPLPLYQLHPLRPAVNHYSRHALRPALHRNGAVPALFPL